MKLIRLLFIAVGKSVFRFSRFFVGIIFYLREVLGQRIFLVGNLSFKRIA